MHLSKSDHPLVAYRAEKKLTQAQFAARLRKRNRRLRVSGAVISRIEKGLSWAQQDVARAILAECGDAVPAKALVDPKTRDQVRQLAAALA